MQLLKAEKEKPYVGKLDIDSFYHHLRLPEQLCTFFGLPLIYIGEDGEKWCPRLVTVPMGWYHSVKTSTVVPGELLFSGASLDER